MAADQSAILGEGDVALDDAGAHARTGHVRDIRVLGELQRRSAMADGKVGAIERAVLALHQLVLKPALVHALDQVERPRAELYARFFPIVVIPVRIIIAVVGGCKRGRDGKQRNGNSQGIDGLADHGNLLSNEGCKEGPAIGQVAESSGFGRSG